VANVLEYWTWKDTRLNKAQHGLLYSMVRKTLFAPNNSNGKQEETRGSYKGTRLRGPFFLIDPSLIDIACLIGFTTFNAIFCSLVSLWSFLLSGMSGTFGSVAFAHLWGDLNISISTSPLVPECNKSAVADIYSVQTFCGEIVYSTLC
jgi:hypothetical protein